MNVVRPVEKYAGMTLFRLPFSTALPTAKPLEGRGF